MNTFVVCVFDTQEQANKGTGVLFDLYTEGEIVIFAETMITKDDDGTCRTVRDDEFAPIGGAGGMILGALIGAFNAPAGIAVAAGGWLADLYRIGVDTLFLNDVKEALTPGKFALVAEIAEMSMVPLQWRMEELGARVIRRKRIDVEGEHLAKDIETTRRDLHDLDQELDRSLDEAANQMAMKMDGTINRLQSLRDRTQERIDAVKAETEARVKAVNDRMAEAKEQSKTRLTKLRKDLQEDCDRRVVKLIEAKEYAMAALTGK